jgi:hypothetical protein
MVSQLVGLARFINARRCIHLVLKEKSLTGTYEQVIAQVQWLLSVCLAHLVSLGYLIAPHESLGLVVVG